MTESAELRVLWSKHYIWSNICLTRFVYVNLPTMNKRSFQDPGHRLDIMERTVVASLVANASSPRWFGRRFPFRSFLLVVRICPIIYVQAVLGNVSVYFSRYKIPDGLVSRYSATSWLILPT